MAARGRVALVGAVAVLAVEARADAGLGQVEVVDGVLDLVEELRHGCCCVVVVDCMEIESGSDVLVIFLVQLIM